MPSREYEPCHVPATSRFAGSAEPSPPEREPLTWVLGAAQPAMSANTANTAKVEIARCLMNRFLLHALGRGSRPEGSERGSRGKPGGLVAVERPMPRRSGTGRMPLFLRATSVGLLEGLDGLIVERDRRAAMALFAYEVERGRRLMAAQTRLALGKVDDAVAAVADLRAGRGDIQREELPAVGFRELLTRMLHHGFERNQLQDGTDGVVRVRDAILEDAHRLRQLLGVGVIDARVPDLRPVEDAPKSLLGHGYVSRGHDGYHPEGKRD